MKKTVIIGASIKPERYSYKAAQKLLEHNHEICLIGNKEGTLFNHDIIKNKPNFTDIDTVTMYISAKFQPEYYDYIISLKPKRVIFNPGTENAEFEERLREHNIFPEIACTLVLLSTNAY